MFVFVVRRTALHWAVKRNHSQVVEFLLETGADKDIQAHDKSTPVHMCTNDSLRQMFQAATADSKLVLVNDSNESTLI